MQGTNNDGLFVWCLIFEYSFLITFAISLNENGPFVFVCSVSQDVERDASTCMASYAKIARIDHSSEPAMTDQHQVF